MDLLKTALLAAVYGAAKFFPIASSAHHAILQKVLGLPEVVPSFYPMAQLGALAALLAHFGRSFFRIALECLRFFIRFFPSPSRRNLTEEFPHARLGGFLFLALVPAIGIHFAFRENLETAFGWLLMAGLGWVLMGMLLLASAKFPDGDRNLYDINHQDAFVIGLAQGLGIFPGLSRTGLAALAGMLSGLESKEAVRFSFLLAGLVIFAQIAMGLGGQAAFFETDPRILGVSFLASALSSYLAIALVLKLIERRLFFIFGFYCLAAGFAALWVSLFPR